MTKVKERKTATKEVILQKAIELGSEDGWHKLTVRNLAERLHYAPPVLYQFFEGKDHLETEILKYGFDLLRKKLIDAAETQQSPEEKLLALALARFDFAIEHHALHSLMFSSGKPVWFKKCAMEGMLQTKEQVTELLIEISGRTTPVHDLISNFIALIKGYTFFATEMPDDKSCAHFFGQMQPKQAFEMAMKRFIASIQNK
ncbi:MAG: TetR/AcrR family transcriptional regulator [Flavobacteriales bacterium]|nr:TetR/AcrR family transcriptional regulator [Flavobacteriales bacterium]